MAWAPLASGPFSSAGYAGLTWWWSALRGEQTLVLPLTLSDEVVRLTMRELGVAPGRTRRAAGEG